MRSKELQRKRNRRFVGLNKAWFDKSLKIVKCTGDYIGCFALIRDDLNNARVCNWTFESMPGFENNWPNKQCLPDFQKHLRNDIRNNIKQSKKAIAKTN